MSDLLVAVRMACSQALTAIQDVSAAAPGTPTTQALLLGALVGLITYSFRKKRYNLPPGPSILSLLGNILLTNAKEVSFYQMLKRWADEKYGPVVTVYMGPMRCVTLNTTEVIIEALIHKGSDFAGRPFLYSLHVMKEGAKDIAFTDYSPAWKLQRKIGVQAIRHYMRGKLLDKALQHIMPMVMERMAAEAGPFDPHTYNCTLMVHLLDFVCFGEPKPFDDPSVKHIIDLLERLTNEIGNGLWEDFIPLLRYWPTKRFLRMCDVHFKLNDYAKSRIEEHKKSFNSHDIRDLTDSILLAQSEAAREEKAEVMVMLTDGHVRQTIVDIFAAGVDTSKQTLDWALLFMAGNPEIQRRAQKEIDAATGSRMPTAEDRSQLQYTEAVLNEVMRVSSVVPLALPHKTLCDTTVGGYDIPKDTIILVNLYAANYESGFWDRPEEFRPERFLEDQGKLKGKMDSWLPFSAGRRVCMGESVARPELLLLLACLLQRFTISLPQEHVYDPSPQTHSLLFRPPKHYEIVVTPR